VKRDRGVWDQTKFSFPMAHLAARRDAAATSPLVPEPRLWTSAAEPLVDIRSADAMAVVHVAGSLALPHAEYADRSLELPPRGTEVRVMIDTTDAPCMELAAALPFLPHEVTAWYDGASEELWASVAAVQPHLVVRGRAPDPSSQPQLWQPGPVIPILVAALRDAGLVCAAGAACTCTVAAAGDSAGGGGGCDHVTILDAGSGTGRNAVHLARMCRRVRVVAVDNRRAMIEKLGKFAARSGVAERITGVVADVMDFVRTTSHRFHAVLAQRFTHRPLLRAVPQLMPLPPTPGWVAVESFAVGASHPTQRDQLLEPGEMADLLVRTVETPGAGGDAHPAVVTAVHESTITLADGRPLLLGVYQLCSPSRP